VPPSVWHRIAQGEKERAIARADLHIIESNSRGSTLGEYEKSRGLGPCGLDAEFNRGLVDAEGERSSCGEG